MNKPWYMEQPFKHLRDPLSSMDLLKLKRFYTQQLALSVALRDGKPLGICKTITSGENPLLDTFLEEEKVARCILSSDASKEMFL